MVFDPTSIKTLSQLNDFSLKNKDKKDLSVDEKRYISFSDTLEKTFGKGNEDNKLKNEALTFVTYANVDKHLSLKDLEALEMIDGKEGFSESEMLFLKGCVNNSKFAEVQLSEKDEKQVKVSSTVNTLLTKIGQDLVDLDDGERGRNFKAKSPNKILENFAQKNGDGNTISLYENGEISFNINADNKATYHQRGNGASYITKDIKTNKTLLMNEELNDPQEMEIGGTKYTRKTSENNSAVYFESESSPNVRYKSTDLGYVKETKESGDWKEELKKTDVTVNGYSDNRYLKSYYAYNQANKEFKEVAVHTSTGSSEGSFKLTEDYFQFKDPFPNTTSEMKTKLQTQMQKIDPEKVDYQNLSKQFKRLNINSEPEDAKAYLTNFVDFYNTKGKNIKTSFTAIGSNGVYSGGEIKILPKNSAIPDRATYTYAHELGHAFLTKSRDRYLDLSERKNLTGVEKQEKAKLETFVPKFTKLAITEEEKLVNYMANLIMEDGNEETAIFGATTKSETTNYNNSEKTSPFNSAYRK